jgi:hypothetical protein
MEGVLRIFIDLKNRLPSTGFELANLGSNGKHAIITPQRTTTFRVAPLLLKITAAIAITANLPAVRSYRVNYYSHRT